MTTVRRRGTGGGGVEAKNEFKIENAGEPKQPLVKTAAAKAEWLNSLNGGEAAKGTLTLESTSNAEKGVINLGAKGAWQEEKITAATGKGATAPRLGIGTTTPVGYLIVEPGTSGVPEEVATAGGSTAAEVLGVAGPAGGNTSIATTGTGGVGSKILLQAGKGGEAAAALTKSSGGKGGEIRIAAGAGTPCLATTTTGVGGSGGALKIESGVGAAGEAVTTGTGGSGGALNFSTGGGAGGKTTGGKGGLMLFQAGNGAAGGTTPGVGGEITFNCGNAGPLPGNATGGKLSFKAGNSTGSTAGAAVVIESGVGGSTGGLGGNVEITAAKGETAEKGGTIILKTGEVERVTVTASGATTVKQTLKVGEGSTLEGAVKAEKTLEVKELLTAKGGLTAEGTVTLPTESITEGEIKAEAITSKKVKIGKPTEVGTKIESGKEEENTHGAVLMMAFLTWEAKEEAHIAKFKVEGVELPAFEVVTAAKGGKAQYTFMLNEKGKWTITLEKGVTGKLMYQEL